MKKILIYFILFPFLAFTQKQEKESIYIYFDKEDSKNRILNNNDTKILFYINTESDDIFIYNELKHLKKCIEYDSIKFQLISKTEAKNKLSIRLKKQGEKYMRETGKKWLPPLSIINYSDYFEKVYIYKKVDSIKGFLYEVDWKYSPIE